VKHTASPGSCKRGPATVADPLSLRPGLRFRSRHSHVEGMNGVLAGTEPLDPDR